jgi:hypothetical protein
VLCARELRIIGLRDRCLEVQCRLLAAAATHSAETMAPSPQRECGCRLTEWGRGPRTRFRVLSGCRGWGTNSEPRRGTERT